jgi:AraC-like DNA-binding protein
LKDDSLNHQTGTWAVAPASLEPLMFGSSLADVFGAPAYDCRVLGPEQEPEFAVTRLRSGPREMEKAPPYPADNAILICVSLTPPAAGQWKARYNGREVGVARAIPFATSYVDLNCKMEMWASGPFDYLHYYLSRDLLARIAVENGVSAAFNLQEAFFIEDLVVAQMTKSILAPVRHGQPLDRLALDHVAMVLGAHTLQQHCGMPKFASRPPQVLEAWQKLRAEEMLRESLKGNISVNDLANACSLSASQFGRRFRHSFGASVHQHLIRLRIDHAKDLLTHSDKSLAVIALQSGFYDQASFTRAFNRIERATPSRWRRFNQNGTAAHRE